MTAAPGDNLPALVQSKAVRQFTPEGQRSSPKETLRKMKRYLLLLEEGNLHHKACRLAGLKSRHVQEFAATNPQFADAIAAAKAEGVEIVEQKLLEAATGENPNLLAVKMFLEANDEKYSPKRADQNHSVLVVTVTSANALDRIRTLKEELQRRDRDIPIGFRDVNPFLSDVGEKVPVDDQIIDAELIDDDA